MIERPLLIPVVYAQSICYYYFNWYFLINSWSVILSPHLWFLYEIKVIESERLKDTLIQSG